MKSEALDYQDGRRSASTERRTPALGVFRCLLILGLAASFSSRAGDYFLDVNGAAAGSGVANGGIYDVGNPVWTTDSTGQSATGALPGGHGGAYLFSAGTDAASLSYAVNGNIAQVSGAITVGEGNVTFNASGAFWSSSALRTLPGTSLNFAPASWDFYSQIPACDTAAGTTLTLNSISTTSGRSGGVSKTGDGLMVITGAASARTIAVTVSGGELRIQNGNAMYTPAYPPPSHTYTVTVNPGGSLELANNITVANNPVTLGGGGYNNLGALRSVSGVNTYASLITLAGNTRIHADAGATLTLNPALGSAVRGPFALTLGGDGLLNISKPMEGLTSLTKDGNGTVTFAAVHTYPGPTTINAGTLRLIESAGVLGGVAGDIVNQATLVVSNTAAQVLTNVISGGSAGQLLKEAAGPLTVTAANPYAGATLISGGKLALAPGASIGNSALVSVTNGAQFDISAVAGFTLASNQVLGGNGIVTGAVICAAGSTLAPGSGGAARGSLSFSNSLTLAGGVTALFDLSANPNGTNDQVLVAGSLLLSGSNTVQVSSSSLSNGTYRLFRCLGGTVNGSVTSCRLQGFIPGAQVAWLTTNAAGTELDLLVTSSSHATVGLVWTGNGANNVWDETNTVAWRNGAVPSVFYQSDLAIFDDSGGANPMVTLVGPLAPGALAVNAAGSYTFGGSGALIGAVSLVKSNAGTLTILTTNRFGGGSLLAGGSVRLGNAAALGSGAVTNNAALVFASPADLTFTNSITGTGSLTNLGGKLTLSASNSFSGGAVVGTGTLLLGHPNALGSPAGATTVADGAVLDLNGLAVGAEPVTLNGTGTGIGALLNGSAPPASLTGPVALATTSGLGGNGSLTLSGPVTGPAGLTKLGLNTLTLAGTNSYSGTTTVAAGTLWVSGVNDTGTVAVVGGATLGGSGRLNGPVTVQSGGTLSLGTNFNALTIYNALTLADGSTTLLKVGRLGSTPTNDSISGISTLTRGGALVVALSGNPVQDGDSFKLFAAGNWTGAFASITLPCLAGGLVWDTSSLSNGTLRSVSLPAVSTFAQRRLWALDQAVENPGAVEDFVLAEVYFTRGDNAGGQATALGASRWLLNNHLANPDEQVQLFDIWPALDCYIRFQPLLDTETRSNIEYVVTHFTGYSGTSTSNLKTLGHVVRYLGSEAFGEAAFLTNAIWKANDPNAYSDLLSMIASNAKNGFGEHASRPYYDKNLLPFLSLAQLATNSIISSRALLAFQGGLSQNAGCWMRGHLGVSTGRSYPDEECQTPMGSMRLLWLYFGGDAPPGNYSDPAFAAVMNYEPLPVIQTAAADRSVPFTSLGGYFGAQQTSFLDRDYVLFSEGPEYYGNFQVYADGVMWTDPDDSHFSFLWLCAPWVDDPATISGSHPHGMNRSLYSEAQYRDSMLQIYSVNPAATNLPNYSLCYVPGGYRAAVNDSAALGKVFLHYGTVMLAISSDAPFTWDPSSGIYAPSQLPVRAGDSEFRVTNTTQFAMAIETTRPDLYAGVTAAEQLVGFRADILAHTGLGHAPGSPPTGYYTNRHGDTLRVQLTTRLSPSPIVINGQPLDFSNWPLTQNPWIYQPIGGPLYLMDGVQVITYDFNAWTVTTNLVPAPPTGLSARAAAPRRVELAWSDNATNETGFQLERATVADGVYTLVADLPANTTSYNDLGVSAASTYSYRLRSYNGPMAFSAYSPAVPVTTPPALVQPCQMRIAFTNYNRGETLTNFPALVVFSPNLAGFDYSTFLTGDGGDLRFYSAGDTNELNYEIENWDQQGASRVWVQLPRFTNNCAIVARWGDPLAATAPGYSTNGATWSDGFAGVWHLTQAPPARLLDSTANANNAVPSGMTPANLGSGQLGSCLVLDGATDWLNIPSSPSLSLANGQFTLSAWVNVDAAEDGVIIGKGQNSVIWYSWFLTVGNNPGVDNGNTPNRVCVGFRTSNGSGRFLATQSSDVPLSKWVQVAGTLDGSNLKLYVNGVLDSSTAVSGAPFDNTVQLWAGADSGRDFLNGRLDEVRVENVARSANWLWAAWLNQYSNTWFNACSPVTVAATNLPAITCSLAGNALTLSWPVSALAQLQSATNLASPITWSPVTTGLITNNGQVSLQIQPVHTRCFYRLGPPLP